jgi:hypothetical protein
VQQSETLFDDLVGEGEKVGRNGQADRLCGFEVDHQSAEFEITLMVKWVTAKSGKG